MAVHKAGDWDGGNGSARYDSLLPDPAARLCSLIR